MPLPIQRGIGRPGDEPSALVLYDQCLVGGMALHGFGHRARMNNPCHIVLNAVRR